MTVGILFILPPVRMRFINYNLSVFIPDKLPVLDFFISPGMIRIEWTHSQKQVYMRVSVSLVVNAPISAHAHVHKGFLDIVCRIGYLFLTAPFPTSIPQPAEDVRFSAPLPSLHVRSIPTAAGEKDQ